MAFNIDKSNLEHAILYGSSIRSIADNFGCSYTNIRYWIRVYGLGHLVHRSKYFYDKYKFIKIVKDSKSIAQVIHRTGRATNGSSYKWVKNEVERLKLDISHWTGQSHGTSSNKPQSWPEILVENSSFRINGRTKARLIKDLILNNTCYICKISPEWMGKPLVLRIDHINGIRNDHRVDNLRLVCPNCDSQLPTFCGRNQKIILTHKKKLL